MAKTKTKYVCQNCGYETIKWFGQCPGCNVWNTMVEEIIQPKEKGNKRITKMKSEKPTPIVIVPSDNEFRFDTYITELNRVLGGGIVPGSMVLIGGEPGIGKSTLVLQLAARLSNKGLSTLYVSGEESTRQIKIRAERIGSLSDKLYVLAETDLNAIHTHIANLQPKLVIVDSIQSVYRPELESAPGSVSQVRECTTQLMYMAKSTNIPIFIIGHVTKAGVIAGPRILEHIVDTVLYFEGERHHSYRILRAVKNRFGSTNEIGIFEMVESGLKEVDNPSEIFLSGRREDVSGSVVVCSLEGTRPLLVELQALVTESNYGTPQRISTGIDRKRLSILLAVLEKRLGYRLGNYDVFINVAGGVQITEPSVDLGILVAVASSFQDLPIDSNIVIIGEVGLGGEVRAINKVNLRLKEAAKLGFNKCIISKKNLKNLPDIEGLDVIGVEEVEMALGILL